MIRNGPPRHPDNFPNDGQRAFPKSILKVARQNVEVFERDWLVWSKEKESLFCFPCRLFSEATVSCKSILSSDQGWLKQQSWHKLYDKVPAHEKSDGHKKCYVQWRDSERRFLQGKDIESQVDKEIAVKVKYWRDLLKRILVVVLFLGERGLAFRGSSNKIDDHNNGNFLGIIQLLAHFDPVLEQHVSKVKQSQKAGQRLQAHYLSADSQNEFIEACSSKVVQEILAERERSKYFSILVDATPDCSHTEQSTFILRYVLDCNSAFVVKERFIAFVDYNKKTGQDIADMIKSELEKHRIPLEDCRGQGYDNGSNMAGKFKGAQAIIANSNPLAKFSNCGAHSLNLCGVHAAEGCNDVITFFGMVQKLYNFFAHSPQSWEILQSYIGCSLHNLSQTRWSARVESVKPIAKHLPLIKHAIVKCKELNLSSECKIELQGIEQYMKSFKCVLMATVWLKILVAIDYRNKVLQAREATLDVEVENIESLLVELKDLRDKWNVLLAEAKTTAAAMSTDLPCEIELPEKRQERRKVFYDESHDMPQEESAHDVEDEFKVDVFYKLIHCVIAGLTQRFELARNINNSFSFLWLFRELREIDLEKKCSDFYQEYDKDVSSDLTEEVKHLKSIYSANLQGECLHPLELLNKLHKLKLESLFPNIVIAIRIFCTIPVTVAEAERSFSKLKQIKSVQRSVMKQDRLNGLATLAIEYDLAKSLNYDDIINDFAAAKARKVAF